MPSKKKGGSSNKTSSTAASAPATAASPSDASVSVPPPAPTAGPANNKKPSNASPAPAVPPAPPKVVEPAVAPAAGPASPPAPDTFAAAPSGQPSAPPTEGPDADDVDNKNGDGEDAAPAAPAAEDSPQAQQRHARHQHDSAHRTEHHHKVSFGLKHNTFAKFELSSPPQVLAEMHKKHQSLSPAMPLKSALSRKTSSTSLLAEIDVEDPNNPESIAAAALIADHVRNGSLDDEDDAAGDGSTGAHGTPDESAADAGSDDGEDADDGQDASKPLSKSAKKRNKKRKKRLSVRNAALRLDLTLHGPADADYSSSEAEASKTTKKLATNDDGVSPEPTSDQQPSGNEGQPSVKAPPLSSKPVSAVKTSAAAKTASVKPKSAATSKDAGAAAAKPVDKAIQIDPLIKKLIDPLIPVWAEMDKDARQEAIRKFVGPKIIQAELGATFLYIKKKIDLLQSGAAEQTAVLPKSQGSQAPSTPDHALLRKRLTRLKGTQTGLRVTYELPIDNLTKDDVKVVVRPAEIVVDIKQLDLKLRILPGGLILTQAFSFAVEDKITLSVTKASNEQWEDVGSIEFVEDTEASPRSPGSPLSNSSRTTSTSAAMATSTTSGDESYGPESPPSSNHASHVIYDAASRRAISEPPLGATAGMTPKQYRRLSLDLVRGSPKSLSRMSLVSTDYDEDIVGGVVPDGGCGLGNEGVDCFMNTVVQCLATIPEFKDYFLSNAYLPHINADNPLSESKGEMARAFAALLRRLDSSARWFFPRKFKAALGQYWALYEPDTQQDAQEFLNFLLDAIHEDVNKIVKKPYIELPDYDESVPDEKIAAEYWDAHAKRNDSIVVDVFQGQYKSKITCKKCNKNSIKFDAFMNLPMEIPVAYMDFNIVYAERGRPKRQVRLSLPSTSSIQEVRKALGEVCDAEENELFGFTVVNHQIFKSIPNSEMVERYLNRVRPEADHMFFNFATNRSMSYLAISHSEVVRRPRARDESGLPFQSSDEEGDEDDMVDTIEPFGWPTVLEIDAGSYSYRRIYEAIAIELIRVRVIRDLTPEDILASSEMLFTFRFCRTTPQIDGQEAIFRHTMYYVQILWPAESRQFFDDDFDQAFSESFLAPPSQSNIMLEDCIAQHLKEEEVEDWYCSNCKTHAEGKKKLDLWRLPKILIVQLKRFVMHPRIQAWTKLETLVNFPVDELDVGQFSVCEEEKGKKYELFAVGNHFGNTEHGHYMAFCKRNGEWYQFDDDEVKEAHEQDICSMWAYVLFYRLKEPADEHKVDGVNQEDGDAGQEGDAAVQDGDDKKDGASAKQEDELEAATTGEEPAQPDMASAETNATEPQP
ncbi:hypothetical protein HK105_203597 [Polyrhizophydium stewartii]|uniref:ubiquitinyl hydrolase 1 n=1 Tax=Polyrhizophydium stewartii TaxID=2732419 RepID=A0ABR4NBD6_9FUNG